MKLSLVIPLYNESQSLPALEAGLLDVLKNLDLDYEIVFIDDGSTDDSFAVLKNLRDDNAKIKIIQFRRNFGKSAALSAGFKYAQGDLIITLDADLQDEPSEIPNLIKKINEGYDLVSGWKQHRQDTQTKLWSSKIFNLTVAKLTGIKLHDFNCGLKIYRSEVIKNIEVYGELHRFLPVLAYQQGFRVAEIKVKHNPRQFGTSKYGSLGLKRIQNYFLDILNVLLITKYFRKPLHFFGSLGLLSFFIGFGIGLYLTILKIISSTLQGHYPLLMLGMLLMIIGIQLVSLGLLGEIIIRWQQKKEDHYNIKNKLL